MSLTFHFFINVQYAFKLRYRESAYIVRIKLIIEAIEPKNKQNEKSKYAIITLKS